MDDCGADWQCAKPRLLEYVTESAGKDELRLTRDLWVERSHAGQDETETANSVRYTRRTNYRVGINELPPVVRRSLTATTT